MAVACFYIGLAWLPLLLSFIISATFLTTYYISVSNGHVNAEFPFISSTGAYPPESCIFAQGLNLSAFLSCLCVYIWHVIIWSRTEFLGERHPTSLLRVTLVIGFLASFGLTLVGNFQQSNVQVVHDIGAGLTFGGTTIYIFLATHICRKYLCYRPIYWISRLLSGIGSLIFFITFFTCHTVARIQYKGVQEDQLTYRTPDEGGWEAFLCSTSCEWASGMFLVIFFLSWAPEFSRYAIELPESVPNGAENISNPSSANQVSIKI